MRPEPFNEAVFHNMPFIYENIEETGYCKGRENEKTFPSTQSPLGIRYIALPGPASSSSPVSLIHTRFVYKHEHFGRPGDYFEPVCSPENGVALGGYEVKLLLRPLVSTECSANNGGVDVNIAVFDQKDLHFIEIQVGLLAKEVDEFLGRYELAIDRLVSLVPLLTAITHGTNLVRFCRR